MPSTENLVEFVDPSVRDTLDGLKDGSVTPNVRDTTVESSQGMNVDISSATGIEPVTAKSTRDDVVRSVAATDADTADLPKERSMPTAGQGVVDTFNFDVEELEILEDDGTRVINTGEVLLASDSHVETGQSGQNAHKVVNDIATKNTILPNNCGGCHRLGHSERLGIRRTNYEIWRGRKINVVFTYFHEFGSIYISYISLMYLRSNFAFKIGGILEDREAITQEEVANVIISTIADMFTNMHVLQDHHVVKLKLNLQDQSWGCVFFINEELKMYRAREECLIKMPDITCVHNYITITCALKKRMRCLYCLACANMAKDVVPNVNHNVVELMVSQVEDVVRFDANILKLLNVNEDKVPTLSLKRKGKSNYHISSIVAERSGKIIVGATKKRKEIMKQTVEPSIDKTWSYYGEQQDGSLLCSKEVLLK
ncbi:hypothetical protein LIER_34096 [Lithospermum erythrorhizon]|uniref:Uncharacterized protein n=1 Tax=Lithospermum erythrorhizon TaxID=34254 RepID=A0AAV3RYH7_LITER